MTAALQEAESRSWSVRAAAGRRLAAWADREGVAPVLERLLLDPDDTAVTQETARALLDRRDLHGLRTVLSALSRAEQWWTVDELVAEVDTDPRLMTKDEGTEEFIEQLSSLACDEDSGVRDEADRLLRRLWVPRRTRQP